jgi:hypothetical protein
VQSGAFSLFLSPVQPLGYSHSHLGWVMKLYRVDKLAKAGGMVVKKKHILATSDRAAVQQAEDSNDCPVCDVLHNGEKVGQVL